MQCARAILITWLGSGSCQARPSRLNTNEWMCVYLLGENGCMFTLYGTFQEFVEWLRIYLMISIFWDVCCVAWWLGTKHTLWWPCSLSFYWFTQSCALVSLCPISVLFFLHSSFFYPQNRDSRFPQNHGNCLPNYKHGYHTPCAWHQEKPQFPAVCCLCNVYTICHVSEQCNIHWFKIFTYYRNCYTNHPYNSGQPCDKWTNGESCAK